MHVVILLALVLCTASCSGDCELTGRTMYSSGTCEPLPPGSEGCVGGPVWNEDGEVHQDDVDTVFPFDCIARVPDCRSGHTNPRTFWCRNLSAGAIWSELL